MNLIDILQRTETGRKTLKKAANVSGYAHHNAPARIKDFFARHKSSAEGPRTRMASKYTDAVLATAHKRIVSGKQRYTCDTLLSELQEDGILPPNCNPHCFLHALTAYLRARGWHLTANCTKSEVWQAPTDLPQRVEFSKKLLAALKSGEIKLEDLYFEDETTWLELGHPKCKLHEAFMKLCCAHSSGCTAKCMLRKHLNFQRYIHYSSSYLFVRFSPHGCSLPGQARTAPPAHPRANHTPLQRASQRKS